MKTLGLLGGMTYHASILYYGQINHHVQKTLGGGHSASLILRSFDFADLIKGHFQHGRHDEVVRQLVQAGQNLKSSGAEAIVLCVNTMHMFAERIEKEVGLPLLHIIDYCGEAAQKRGMKTIALLGTKPSMDGDFLVGRLRQKFGLEVLLPDEKTRFAMDEIIFGDLASNIVTEPARKLYKDCVDGLVADGAEGVILACTELSFVVKQEDFQVPLFDTVELHAKGVAEWSLNA